MATGGGTFEELRNRLLGMTASTSQAWAICLAILMLATEVRDLTDIIDRRLSSLRDGQAER